MRRGNPDGNQGPIVDALRQVGAGVQLLTSVGDGCPDLLVSFRGANHVLEVKTENGRLRASQVIWHRTWRAPVHVVRNPEEALRAIGAL